MTDPLDIASALQNAFDLGFKAAGGSIHPLNPAVGGDAVAWAYELATQKDSETGEYRGWVRRLSRDRPNTPEGSMRNLRALYAAPPAHPLRGRGLAAVEKAISAIENDPRSRIT